MAADAIVTPHRKTHLRIDIDNPVQTETLRSITRSKNEMAALGLHDTNSSNVEQLPTGCIKLKPYHANINKPHELTAAAVQNSALVESDWDLAEFVKVKPIWRIPSDLPGVMALNPDVASTGDYFFQKSPAASDNWIGNDLEADRLAYGNPVNTHFQMERHGVTKQNIPANKEVALRFDLPGTSLHCPYITKIFYFGGPVDQTGHGCFALVFTANGMAFLQDRVNFAQSTADVVIPNSVPVDSWRYAPAHRTSGLAVYMRIIPHLEIGGGGYIAFVQENSTLSGGGAANLFIYSPAPPSESLPIHIYRIPKMTFVATSDPTTPLHGPQPDGTPITIVPRTSITDQAPLRIDIPTDQRLRWQVLQAKHPETGYFIDADFVLANCNVSAELLLTWQAIYPNSDCTIVGTILDGLTGMALASTGSTANSATFTPNPGTMHYRCRFDFTGDIDNTPFLWSWAVYRAGTVTTDSPGESVIPDDFEAAQLRQYSITGPEQDLSHETAATTVEDPANEVTAFANHAIIQAQLETEYDPSDSTKRSVLFRGEITRTDATLKGAARTSGTVFPSPEWNSFAGQWNGMYARLSRALTVDKIPLAPDPDDPDGNAYQVTDICTSLLADIIGSSMVNIPTSTVRFSPAREGGSGDLIIAPGTNRLEMVVKFLREYLGWFLIWDANANAGSGGQIRALGPSLPIYGTGGNAYKNLANFTMDTPGPGCLPNRPESFGSGQTNWTGTDATNVVAPVIKRTYKAWTKPMEANWIIVTASGQLVPNADNTFQLAQWAVNSKSFNCFKDASGSVVVTQDRTSPDFLGYEWPIVIMRPDLWTQDQVDRMTRRYYDQCCHAVKMCSFEAPLVLVTDTTDAAQSQPRPLRFYDPVTVTKNGVAVQWLVRNCNIDVRKDSYQKMVLELQKPVVTGTIGQ